MLISILEAQVVPGRVGELERSFQATAADSPSEVVESFRARDRGESTHYQIVTMWRSWAASWLGLDPGPGDFRMGQYSGDGF